MFVPFNKYGCEFRLVNEDDAAFVYRLRTDPLLSKYLNPVKGNVKEQVNWIREYKKREILGLEYYFISSDPISGSKLGLNRLCNFKKNSFEIGSWLYLPQSDISKSILGDIAIREFGFDSLGYENCHFEVRKENKSVVRYHKGYFPDLVMEDSLNYYFILTKEKFNRYKTKYLTICGYGQHK
jgi:hypothetical protein